VIIPLDHAAIGKCFSPSANGLPGGHVDWPPYSTVAGYYAFTQAFVPTGIPLLLARQPNRVPCDSRYSFWKCFSPSANGLPGGPVDWPPYSTVAGYYAFTQAFVPTGIPLLLACHRYT
jgi:hypothetical protein